MRYLSSLVGEEIGSHLDCFDGVGLIRGEFFQRRTMTSILSHSVQSYLKAYLDAVCGRRSDQEVWYRISDLWVDEANALSGRLPSPPEENPIVGLRGAERILAISDETAAEVEVLAAVASQNPNFGVIVPFVRSSSEFAEVFEVLSSSLLRCPVGSMVEVPSAALQVKELVSAGAARLLIGINDLSCLTSGTSRTQSDEIKLSDPLWELIKRIVADGHSSGVEVGLAGRLSERVLALARESGIDYASIHYCDAPEVLGRPKEVWPDMELQRNIKRLTRRKIGERLGRTLGGVGVSTVGPVYGNWYRT